MLKRPTVLMWTIALVASACTFSQAAPVITSELVTISVDLQHQTVRPNSNSALAIHFELKKDWHFYASAKTAPGQMHLKIKPSTEKLVTFFDPVFPESRSYFDKSSDTTLEVFSDKFTVFLPFKVDPFQTKPGETIVIDINVGIDGAVCSDIQCQLPNFDNLSTELQISADASMSAPKFILPDSNPLNKNVSYSALFALLLALLAGLSLNIMPCVWPILPIIVMRIIEQAKANKTKSVAMGLTFCFGILLFFACLASANIILQIFYGTVLQWGDQFRNPAFVGAMALLLIVMALFMFGLFAISLPSSISSKSSGSGFAGANGMGFLAALLSTPCSFAILATAFAWAQAQPLLLATIAIMVIGIGMAIPYAILTSMPGLLKRLPKAGRWMELFKQAIGFVLLAIAVKLIGALPQAHRIDVLYFSVILAFCIWMWGTWVSYNTKPLQKWLVRIIAVIIVIAGGWTFLPAPAEDIIDWQKYDAKSIEDALEKQRPVLIKFTADWCLSCQVVEKTVYAKEDIAKLIEEKRVLAIKADTTTKNLPATLALKNIYNEPGVPVTILFVPGQKEPVRWRSMSFADELKSQLEKISP